MNGLSDGTKDITVNDVTANGDVTLGASTADSVTSNGTWTGNVGGAVVLTGAGARTPGWTSNLGMSLAAGTLTITNASGAALSAANPGHVSMTSVTGGQTVNIQITTPITVNDDAHASSNFTNFGAGITESVNWGNDMPWFLYVVNKGNAAVDGTDGNSALCLTRNFAMSTSPSAAGNIGDTDAIPTTDDQTSILLLGSYTEANYTSLPCQLIGVIRMQWATATTDWTIQSLSVKDGIGQGQLDKAFATNWTYPAGQSTLASRYIANATSTSGPVFTTNEYTYRVFRNGLIHIEVYLDGDGGTDGGLPGNSVLWIPYTPSGSGTPGNTKRFYIGYALAATTITGGVGVIGLQLNAAGFQMEYQSSATATSAITDTMWTNGNRRFQGSFQYRAY